ncbi:phage holin family protein [Bacteroidales bacterium OttesenSCG-928-B11]|nr:phage holin family protein [Bacteroidales bacterium OttesenSCG-928-C03]MDL2311731.1 phage holin family protein [Bacteroidales bacterium OttesenSCG-928-B11]MDL2325925.1 phage holin family protein [Bacteroidales bacterium OttesenSCG-928-A14]
MGIVLQVFISSVAVYFTAWLLPGISVKSYGASIIVAIVLGLLNAFVKPFLQFVSLPITALTMGLFLFVINALVIMIASWLLSNRFQVSNFWWALLFSIIVSFVSGLLSMLIS